MKHEGGQLAQGQAAASGERNPGWQLVTGGAGFIGSCYVLEARRRGIPVLNLDALTYAGNPENLAPLAGDEDHVFVRGDIGNAELVAWLLERYQPAAIVNFAAESHVDRSIVNPEAFVQTNVLGTATLLRTVRDWWGRLAPAQAEAFRFLHVSTDEVFGALGPRDPAFTESTPYLPRSPYSASKAASDHLVRAFHETYGLPTLVTNCSNNYGPRQFPEKLIPLLVLRALAGESLPIYGKGANVRDWLHVEDHCRALATVLAAGKPGQSYNIGGRAERSNLEVARAVCTLLDELAPGAAPRESLITFVSDRPGHDFRYAMNCSRIEEELGWRPAHDFESGLRATVAWYLANPGWLDHVQTGAYREWLGRNYGARGPAA